MSTKSCDYMAGIKYSRKKNVKGGPVIITKIPGFNWTPSNKARKHRAWRAMEKINGQRAKQGLPSISLDYLQTT